MRNITTARKGNILTITVDLSKKGTPSGSGKNEVVATTSGNVSIDGDGGFKMGLNIYKPIS